MKDFWTVVLVEKNYTRMKGIKTGTLKELIRVYNVDGTPNKRGTIRSL